MTCAPCCARGVNGDAASRMMASALYEQHGAYAAAPAPDAWGAQAGRTRLNALFEEAASRGPPTPLAAPPPPLLLARTPSQPPGYGYGSAPPPYVDPLAPRRRDGFAPGWPRVVGAAPPVVAPPSKQQLTAARQAAESGRVVWRSRADLLRRLAAREWLTRWCAPPRFCLPTPPWDLQAAVSHTRAAVSQGPAGRGSSWRRRCLRRRGGWHSAVRLCGRHAGRLCCGAAPRSCARRHGARLSAQRVAPRGTLGVGCTGGRARARVPRSGGAAGVATRRQRLRCGGCAAARRSGPRDCQPHGAGSTAAGRECAPRPHGRRRFPLANVRTPPLPVICLFVFFCDASLDIHAFVWRTACVPGARRRRFRGSGAG